VLNENPALAQATYSMFARLRIPQIACKSGLTDDATNGNGIRRPSLARAVSPATKVRRQSETYDGYFRIMKSVNEVSTFFSHNLRARITRITRNILAARWYSAKPRLEACEILQKRYGRIVLLRNGDIYVSRRLIFAVHRMRVQSLILCF
jgi:hypothetical protein